jgi:lysozyme
MEALVEVSQQAVNLIKEFEGFSPVPYKCPAGKNTIGYGHVIEAKPFLTHITQEEAELILRKELERIEVYLNSVIKKDVKVTQGMFDAMASLVFNWGFRGFGHSVGLVRLNNKRYVLAAQEFFSKEKGVVNIKGKFSKGLYRRRQAELELWNDKT